MPQNKPMKIQWITVNGRQVPLVLPQHWNGSDWVVTGVDNPLPTVDYGTTESGIIIPKRVSDDGAAHTQVTGSIVAKGTFKNVEILADAFFETPTINASGRELSFTCITNQNSNIRIQWRDVDGSWVFEEPISNNETIHVVQVIKRTPAYRIIVARTISEEITLTNLTFVEFV